MDRVVSTATTKRKVLPACFSCKRLKIKCDRVRPKCEYCNHMNKICEYPADAGALFQVNKIININSFELLLNVTEQEAKLLKFYMKYHSEMFSCKPRSEQERVWGITVPSLWNSNEVVRNAIYCIASVQQWHLYDINMIEQVAWSDDKTLPELTFDYFEKCSVAMFEMFKDIESNYENIIVLNYTIFSFLCLHPYSILPLLSTNNNPDILSIVMNFKQSLRVNAMRLFNSDFAPLLYLDERIVPDIEVNYRFTSSFKKKLLNDPDLDKSRFLIFHSAIYNLEVAIYRSLEFKYPLPLFRYLFVLDLEIYKILRQENNIIAYKVLFFYSCFSLLLNFTIYKSSNIWMGFINFYKDLGLFDNNYYWDEDDQFLYFLIINNESPASLLDLFELN